MNGDNPRYRDLAAELEKSLRQRISNTAGYDGPRCPHCDEPSSVYQDSVTDEHGQVWHQRCIDIFDGYADEEPS